MRGKIERAIKVLRAGGVIAFPTETVYGIGAILDKPEAVKKIYRLKKRPRSKPLQILIGSHNQLKRLARSIPPQAKKLIEENWPGPLTIIFRKSKFVPKIVCGKTNKVGLRMPDHPIALELIRQCGPIVATSANLSGQSPALTARQAKKNLPGIDYFLDGGKAKIGQASKVIDVSGERIKIIRE